MTRKLIDDFGRLHTNLRVSVTDRCNMRCFYCMPSEFVQFKPRHELLTFDELERFVKIMARMGVQKIRVTGGEPLLRKDLPMLIRRFASVNRITDVAITTNGILLPEQARELKEAGLHRLNISLDGLSEETFRSIARRDGLDRVLEGIAVAQALGFDRIRLNAVAIQGITENEIVPLGRFARERHLELRFIEFMPLNADGQWEQEQVLSGEMVREQLEDAFGPLEAVDRPDPSQPAVDYQFADGVGRIGFITPISQPFCADCNRLRITAEGQVRNCLFSTSEWDARRLLREGASDQEIGRLVAECVAAKEPGHGIESAEFQKPLRAMYQIGG